MLYLEIHSTDGGTYEEIEIDQFQAEVLKEALDNHDSGVPQVKRLKEFFRALKSHVDQDVVRLTAEIVQREQQLKNMTFRP